MAISSKIEEVVHEVSKIAGEVYDTLSKSLGSVDTPSSAIFEINNRTSNAQRSSICAIHLRSG